MVSRLYVGRPLELGCRTGSPTTRSLTSAAAVKPPIQGGASTAYKASPMATLTSSDAHLSTRKICSTTETSSRTRIPGIAKVKRIIPHRAVVTTKPCAWRIIFTSDRLASIFNN
jgi:hypothetical protein